MSVPSLNDACIVPNRSVRFPYLQNQSVQQQFGVHPTHSSVHYRQQHFDVHLTHPPVHYQQQRRQQHFGVHPTQPSVHYHHHQQQQLPVTYHQYQQQQQAWLMPQQHERYSSMYQQSQQEYYQRYEQQSGSGKQAGVGKHQQPVYYHQQQQPMHPFINNNQGATANAKELVGAVEEPSLPLQPPPHVQDPSGATYHRQPQIHSYLTEQGRQQQQQQQEHQSKIDLVATEEFESTNAVLQSVDLDCVAAQALVNSLDKELADNNNGDDNIDGKCPDDENSNAASVSSSSSTRMTVNATTTQEALAMKNAINIISLKAPRKADESMHVMENIISNRITSVGKKVPSSSSSSSEDEESHVAQEALEKQQSERSVCDAKKKKWKKKVTGNRRKDLANNSGKIPAELYKTFSKLFSLFNNNQRSKLQRILVSLATDTPRKKMDVHIKFFNNPSIDESAIYAKYIPKGSDEKVLQDFEMPHANVVFAHTLMVLSIVDESKLSFHERIVALWVRVYCNVKKINRKTALLLLQNEFAKIFGTNEKKLLEYFKKYSNAINRKKRSMPEVSPSDVEEDEENMVNDKNVPHGFDAVEIAKKDLHLHINPSKCKWSGVFHADNIKSPVTISDCGTAKLDKVKVSYCVNHSLTNCYIYNVSGLYESTYAITCTLLNALFFSERWMQRAKYVIPPILRSCFVSMYRKCCANSVASKAYLDVVGAWIYPSMKFSHSKLLEQTKSKRTKSAHDIMIEDQTNDVLANCSRSYIARVFAQLLLDMPISSSNITDVAIKDRYAREVEMCRANDISSIKDLLHLIANGKMNIGVQMLIDSYLNWSMNTLPPLTSPEARIYEIPDKSESCYLDFKNSFPYQKHVDSYSILNPLFFSPCIDDDQKEPGTEAIYGYGTMTFWITVLAYFLCAKSIKNAKAKNASDSIDAPDVPRQSMRIKKHLVMQTKKKKLNARLKQGQDGNQCDANTDDAENVKTVWNSIETDQIHGMIKRQDDSRPMVFIFWAKPKDKAFLHAFAKAVNTIVRLHRGNDDMSNSKAAHARNIYTCISNSNPTKEYFENGTLTMYFYVNDRRPMLFTKYDNTNKCTITIKVDSQGADFSSCESAKHTSSMDDRISGDLHNQNIASGNDCTGCGELGVTNYVCPKALVNLMRLKCNVLITDGTLTMDFIVANYCNGTSLYSNIKKIANHFGFVENREVRQTVGSMHTCVDMITTSKECENVDVSTQQYLASYPIMNRNLFIPLDMRDDTIEIVDEDVYDRVVQQQQLVPQVTNKDDTALVVATPVVSASSLKSTTTRKRKTCKFSQQQIMEENEEDDIIVSPKKKRRCKIIDTTPTNKRHRRGNVKRSRRKHQTHSEDDEENENEENDEEEEVSTGKKQSAKRKSKKTKGAIVLDMEDQYADEMCCEAS